MSAAPRSRERVRPDRPLPVDPDARQGVEPVAANESTTPLEAIVVAPEGDRPVRRRRRADPRALVLAVLPPLLGLGLLVGAWALVAAGSERFPTPAGTWDRARQLLAGGSEHPAPDDAGLGRSLLQSLGHVGVGAGLAALLGLPLGFAIGRLDFLARLVAPLVAVLRPVSPFAWLPIGLLAFAAGDRAVAWTVGAGALWPVIAHTAAGVRGVPRAWLDVGRLLDLSSWRVFTRIVLPAALPAVLVGVRRSLLLAWLLVVGAEMITGAAGIGAWTWAAWQHLDRERLGVAIVAIGVVGAGLEQVPAWLARRVARGRGARRDGELAAEAT